MNRLLFPILFIAGSAFAFLCISTFQIHQSLGTILNRTQEDITYKNGIWDTTAYNADPTLPGTAPLYILASDGFVIERWKPINGFLDVSDFKHLLQFDTPQTITTHTDQIWRIVSIPIKENEITIGVVSVSSYHPFPENLQNLDKELLATAATIKNQVVFQNGNLTINNFNERQIPYYISYQVVNNSNLILLKSNNSNSIDRIPNFIDPSYIARELRFPHTKIIRDQKTKEVYLIRTRPLLAENTTKGVIVVGKSINSLLILIGIYTFFMIGIAILAISTQKIYISWYRKKMQRNQITTVFFDVAHSILTINEEKIPILYATNQYYLCQAIFSQKRKRWEVDELLEKFGEHPSKHSSRKVYEAVNLVNRKTVAHIGKKLIVADGKTYRFNPELL